MSIPSAASAALAARSILVGSWLEIEGIPYAYGTFTAAGSWFSARSALLQFLGVKPQLLSLPKLVAQTIDTLKGGNLSTGQAVFEILDKDAQPTYWTSLSSGSFSIANAVTAAATSWNMVNAGGINVGDYLYAGTETVQVTAKFVNTITVTRGMFRSTPQAFPSLFPVSAFPYAMANRRCWFYQVFDASSRVVGTWSSLTLDASKVLRFAGQLTSYHLKDNDPASYVLTAESVDREMNRPAFRNLRQFRLSGTSIKDGLNSGAQPCQVSGWPGYSPNYDTLWNFDASDFTLNEKLLLMIDDELFVGEITSMTPAKCRLLARAMYGTKADVHKEGAIVREIVPVVAHSNQTTSGQNAHWAELISKFNAIPLYPGDVGADHPVILALTVLCSTGLGTNFDPVYRNCDRLPAEWGMGISHTRIDWAVCEAAAREEPALRFTGTITEPMNAVEFVRQLLTFAGYYFTVATGDLLTIRRLRPPLPDQTTRAITNSNRIRNHFPTWDANWSGAIRQLHFKYGYDILSGKHKRVAIFTLNDADIFSKGLAKTVELETRLVYPGGSGIPGDIVTRAFDVDMWLLQRAEYYRTRYGRPPPIIKERVDYSFLDVEVGDIVAVTSAILPSNGARGMASTLGEVIGKDPDDAARVIDLTILMTGELVTAAAYIAPSITAGDDGNSLVDLGSEWRIEQADQSHTGFDAYGGSGGADINFTTQGGSAFDWTAETYVLVIKSDFSQRELVAITGIGSDYIQFVKPAWSFTDGDIITIAPAFDSPSILGSPFFAAWADAGDLNGETPYLYFPA